MIFLDICVPRPPNAPVAPRQEVPDGGEKAVTAEDPGQKDEAPGAQDKPRGIDGWFQLF